MRGDTAEILARRKCVPCEGGVERFTRDDAQQSLQSLPGWTLSEDASRIRKLWTVKNFKAGIDFFERVALLAEAEGHHPDLHLDGYRRVTIELWTHAIGGLSANDFVLAQKIDELPIELKTSAS